LFGHGGQSNCSPGPDDDTVSNTVSNTDHAETQSLPSPGMWVYVLKTISNL